MTTIVVVVVVVIDIYLYDYYYRTGHSELPHGSRVRRNPAGPAARPGPTHLFNGPGNRRQGQDGGDPQKNGPQRRAVHPLPPSRRQNACTRVWGPNRGLGPKRGGSAGQDRQMGAASRLSHNGRRLTEQDGPHVRLTLSPSGWRGRERSGPALGGCLGGLISGPATALAPPSEALRGPQQRFSRSAPLQGMKCQKRAEKRSPERKQAAPRPTRGFSRRRALLARARGQPQGRDFPQHQVRAAGLRPSPRRAGRGEETQPDPAEAGGEPVTYPGRHCPQDPADPAGPG